ncbi:MAG TPA: hypothetical protein VLE97_08855 [Gaiellaceae bacterium]|nr:hypothetical protein [Gaiellaceae bacterium]
MPLHRFDDECPGCRPAMMNIKTRQLYADDSIEMITVNRLWAQTTVEERKAWHRVTCKNSRSLVDLSVAQAFADRIEAALRSLPAKEKS